MLPDLNLPVYTQWAQIPPGLATKTQLSKERLTLPEDAQPVAYKKSVLPTRYYGLYRREDAQPMPPKRKGRDYAALFQERYPSPRSAYVAACEALFHINRYAKHERCAQGHREAIYALKSKWIERLYMEGFCTEAMRVVTPKKALPCYECCNTPEQYVEDCWKCDGTGIYRTVGGREYWAFRFAVDGQAFAWHQRGPLAFVAVETAPQEEREVIATEKPVLLPPRKFAEAKALIAWCLAENVETCVSEL